MRHELKVNRTELEEGLKRLRKAVKRKTKGPAALSHKNGTLTVSLDNVEIEVSAEGTFAGIARIPGTQAINLSRALPPDDPMTISCDGERLYISNLSLSCSWTDD